MNSAIALATFFVVAGTQPTGMTNLVAMGEENPKYEELINFEISQREAYLKISSDPISYEELLYYAMYDCKNNKEPNIDLLLSLVEVEKTFNPPPSMRGMLLAAACMESGYNPYAKGDRKFSKNKRTPMAIGILQMWPVYKRIQPGLDRTDPIASSYVWMQHIVSKIPKVKRQCRYKKPSRVWLAAWVTGIRYKKAGGRCKERPNHYRLLKKWHKKIKKDRAKESYCRGRETCGC